MKQVLSAGGLIFKKEDDQLNTCLVKSFNSRQYTFPKGHVEAGEKIEDAAIREVKEELGFREVRIIKKIGVLTRTSNKPSKDGQVVEKEIHMFLVKTNDLTHKNPEEVYKWFNIKDVYDYMFHESEQIFLKNFVDDYFKEGEVNEY